MEIMVVYDKEKNTAIDFSGTTSNVYEPSVFTSATHGNTIMFGYINGYMQSTLVQVYETAEIQQLELIVLSM